jgi:Zn-dependent M28 family amino/carboxypeptidase
MRALTLALISALALTACKKVDGGGDSAPLPAVEAGQLSEATMKEVVKELSQDSYEGRAPGGPGEEKTVALLIEKFKAAGLAPGNPSSSADGGWTQAVPLVEVTAKNYSPLTFAGSDGKAMSFTHGSDFVANTYQEQPKIDIKDSDVVFVGYGINSPEKGWNDYAGVDVKGKTVLILVNDPDFDTEGLDGPFGGKAMTYYGRWTYKYEEAARQGAAAALIIHDTAPAAYGWNVVNSSWTGPQFMAQSKNGGADQTKANGWVQKEVAEKLMNAGGQDLSKAMAAAKQKGFKAVPLNIKAGLTFENTISKKNSRNVVGILKGAKRPDEYVLYTGHWDHLGRCVAAPDGDDICNGAIDNATGTAALVALAEGFTKAGAPDRSVVFLAVTAEESGLLGSKYYAENPIYPLGQTVGGVNMDAFSMAGPAKNLTVIGMGKSDLDAYVAAAAKADGRTPEREPTPEKGFYYRSDHFSFAKLGVPMVYFEGGDDLVKGGREAGKAVADDYEKNHYHGPKDEYDESWDWSGVMGDLQLYYRIGRQLAMTTAWPNWKEGDEFRAIRDKSRTGK